MKQKFSLRCKCCNKEYGKVIPPAQGEFYCPDCKIKYTYETEPRLVIKKK